ncbi:hypothetical protein JR552_001785 [Listeria monocytogenes serotype 1/2b]|uniref:YopX protein domain-containing protein n=1 Tax=Listeria seeligeri TaxID=1640 RepID=A0A7X0X1Y0_LISSE|nr:MULTISPECIES: YopX family protein [Listeria]EHC6275927.1 hypothetical protein [Listeria monocytogenes serotype 1/2b]EAW7161185.1 hypothetical protein [Listeria monocytogenes]EBD1549898.1 hypothetical protein [Listeria monocytogenes]EBH4254721.1 hypothetical protein [Listeria monocytogenes]ECP2270509.1 hypothetical protein [Listeria monocytogenes]
MREIEFRAKVKRSLQLEQIKNGWIHGGIFENKIISRNTNEDSICAGFCSEVEIIQETVGQYIGIKDMNGTKIFEGDILKIVHEDGAQFYSEVKYFADIDYPAFDIQFPDGFYFESNVINEAIQSGFFELSVAGNIHENPELLEVAE